MVVLTVIFDKSNVRNDIASCVVLIRAAGVRRIMPTEECIIQWIDLDSNAYGTYTWSVMR